MSRVIRKRIPVIGDDFTLREVEDAHIKMLLASGRTLGVVAEVLGIEPSTLWRKRCRSESKNGSH